jgi:rubredoxin
METFVCNNCRFRFKAENPHTCPYCGKGKSFQKEPSAEDLLDEVESLLRE